MPVEITTFAMTEMGWVFAFGLNETMENVVSNSSDVIKNHRVTDFEIKRKYLKSPSIFKAYLTSSTSLDIDSCHFLSFLF